MEFILIIVIIGIVIFISNNAAKTKQQKWRTAAAQLGLSFRAGGAGSIGTISGRLHGHAVAISTFTRGSGNSRQTYTKYKVRHSTRLPGEFNMVKQGLRHRLGKVFGLQDIEVGNPAFDELILLRASNPVGVKHFLTPRLQGKIRSLVLFNPDVVITHESIVVNRRGTDTDFEILSQTVHRIIAVCDVLVEDEAPKSSEQRELEPIEPSSLPGAPVPSPRPVAPEPPPLPKFSKSEWVVISEEEDAADVNPGPEATANPEDILEELHPEPEPKITIEELRTKPAEEVRDPSVEGDQPVGADEPEHLDSLDLKALASELLGGDSRQLLEFEAHYKGRRVTGSGVLRRVNKFSYDRVFTNCEGVKAIVAICELAGPYSKIKVDAVVKYPAEEYEELRAKIDTTLSISGTLIAQDTTMNQYYVES
jgi:hypothetical protein